MQVAEDFFKKHFPSHIFQICRQVDDSYVPYLESTDGSWRGKSRSIRQQPSAKLLTARYKRKVEVGAGLRRGGSCSAEPEVGNLARRQTLLAWRQISVLCVLVSVSIVNWCLECATGFFGVIGICFCLFCFCF